METSLDTDLIISLISIFVLLCLSGFFSGSETALTAASKAKMHSLEKDGNKRAGLVNRMREQKDKLIGALLLGNNLVNILASALATSALIKLFGEAGVVYATLAMTVLVLIFAEVLPKSYAIIYSDKMALAIAPIINVLVRVLSPITQAIIFIVRQALKVVGVDLSEQQEDGKQELLGVIDLHQVADSEEEDTEEAHQVRQERAMLRSILDLAEVEVDEVMTHRNQVEMIDLEQPKDEIVKKILDSQFTRIPLYRPHESEDDIVGVIHQRRLLRALHDVEGDVSKLDFEDMASGVWYVPDSTTLLDQLHEFRERREHFAFVVDEYGSFQGVVTLEDILEEIVGEIDDEHDVQVTGVTFQKNGTLLVDGTVTIRDLNREFEWRLPSEHYSTVAGLLIHESKMIPEPGQSFSFHGMRFDVLKRENNQITKLRITPLEEGEE